MSDRKLLYFIQVLLMLHLLTGCHDEPLKINYEMGIFPDSVITLDGLNTQYDDYNMDIEAAVLNSTLPVVFSSNRQSSGGEFDLTQGMIWYVFGQTTGMFQIEGEMTNDPFLVKLISVFNTAGDEFGPFRFFNGSNGLEYMSAATRTADSGLDIVFTNYVPVFLTLPAIADPVPATVFNSDSDDAYLCLSTSLDTAYFCSDRSGSFDIYMMARPSALGIDEWFSSPSFAASSVDSINSASDEKCPFIRGRHMVFASDMPGGYGGFDLYYSVFRGGKWSSPVNLGPEINSPGNEYRPVLGIDLKYENRFLIFSSDRQGGMGGYDLYFTGIALPAK
ncbi:hypothetical protein EG827_07745 [bacterium]|nr:hypothetical protein [bacterium]